MVTFNLFNLKHNSRNFTLSQEKRTEGRLAALHLQAMKYETGSFQVNLVITEVKIQSRSWWLV